MKRFPKFLLLSVLVFLLFSQSAAPGVPDARNTRLKPVSSDKQSPVRKSSFGTAALDTAVFASFDFDDGIGGPDTQGWTTADVTVTPDTFFHVDDFAGLGTGYSPLEGTKSLWCGVRRTVETCRYATLPGYGHTWSQVFESVAFPVTGNVGINYMIRYDSESGYDKTSVRYLSKSGLWHNLHQYDGMGETVAAAGIPADSMSGSVKLQFLFESDGVWDDEDGKWDSNGAVIIDDILVSDGGGQVDQQDFESENPGDMSTSDGDWTASTGTGFGDFAGLFSGLSVVQEDPLVTNTTYFWGFFNGSTYNYACGGFPAQLVVPYGPPMGAGEPKEYIRNQIQSGPIDLSRDIHGAPVPEADRNLTLECDIYLDLSLSELVFYEYSVRYLVMGCWTGWTKDGFNFYGESKEWDRRAWEFIAVPGATHAQVAIGVWDMARIWYGVYGTGECHSHGPLIDNVVLYRRYDAIVVTNTNNSGPGSLRQALTDANAAPDTNVVAFDIPGAGPHDIRPATFLPALTSPVIIDGFTQFGSSPNTNGPGQPDNAIMKIVINGRNTSLPVSGIRLSGGNSIVRGVVINNFDSNGIQINSSGNAVEGCYIGVDAGGVSEQANNGNGIYSDPAQTKNHVGGPSASQRNIISGNGSTGVTIGGGHSHVVEGNFIGTDRTGTSAIPNGTYGVYLGNAGFSTVGGETAAHGNLISGNTTSGLLIFQGSENDVYGNLIGTDITGTLPVGNGQNGIYFFPTTAGFDIEVGAKGTYGRENIIAYNGQDGVRVGDGHLGTYEIYGNSIFSNTELGVDVGPNGVTPNSPVDGLQDYPVLTAATTSASGTAIDGTVTSSPSTPLWLSFFSSPECDPSGYGEGKEYLGWEEVTTDGAGNAVFSATVPGQALPGHLVTATATARDDSTSEFSQCIVALNTTTGLYVTVEPPDSTTGENPVSVTFENVTSDGVTELDVADSGPAIEKTYITGDPPMYFYLTTTATYTGTIRVCINYDEDYLTGPEDELELLHWNTSTSEWDTITMTVDTLSNIICGSTPTLSPFIMVKPNPLIGIAGDGTVPAEFALHQNVPNPFNPTTVIRYDVPAGDAVVTLRVYDVAGRLVRTLVDERQTAGRKSATWDGRNNRGITVATGVYFYRMQAGNFVQTRKMLLLK
jgi:hypothetical protein